MSVDYVSRAHAPVAPPECGLTTAELTRLLEQERQLRQFDAQMAYTAGFAAGVAEGMRQADYEMDAAWRALAATVRVTASNLTGRVAEPAVRPQPDDSIWFTAEEQEALAWSDAGTERA